MWQRVKSDYKKYNIKKFIITFLPRNFTSLIRKVIYKYTHFKTIHSPYEYGLNKNQDRQQKIIVSLTTFSARFNTMHISLKSILLQSMKPDKIIVWLDDWVTDDQFTEEMKKLQQCGVEFRKNPGALKSHKKYIHAMKEFPNDLIITIDDDLIYSSNLIKSLVEVHLKYPNAVCARRVHKMICNKDDKILPYNEWQKECKKVLVPANDLMATGVGGVLYPPNCLDKRAFDYELIEKLCLKADDVWLKCMEIIAGVSVVWVPCHIVHPQAIEEFQQTALRNDNVERSHNDIYLQKVMEYFEIIPKDIYGR